MKLIVDIPNEEFELDKFLFDSGMGSVAVRRILNGTPLPECKDCKYFERDFVTWHDGVPLILSHEICKKWGDGCKTRENGYCFLFEAKEEKNDNL